MLTTRRVYFNPTSIPGLRSPGAPRRDFYNAGNNPRLGLKSGLWKWRGVRKESTETGENRTGHINATANEGILFFDSEMYTKSTSDISLTHIRHFPLEAHLASTIAMASRTKPP